MGSQVNKLWALELPSNISTRHVHRGPGISIVTADWPCMAVSLFFFFFCFSTLDLFEDYCLPKRWFPPCSRCQPHSSPSVVISMEPDKLKQVKVSPHWPAFDFGSHTGIMHSWKLSSSDTNRDKWNYQKVLKLSNSSWHCYLSILCYRTFSPLCSVFY